MIGTAEVKPFEYHSTTGKRIDNDVLTVHEKPLMAKRD
jgi:hypothetical protein